MTATIHLGFEIDSGEPVAVPLRHLVVTGQTQESGKTTTLEALVARSGLRAIAFVTKRGEGSFSDGRRIQPYFRDRADWQFVDQLLEAQLREKNKFLRPWLIRICRSTRTLADVHEAVKKALKKAKGINEGVYTQLDAYLDLIVPEIGKARLADRIDLSPGLNVMDLSGYSTPMQMLFVQSAIDWVNERENGVVTIIPEAWEFIPETKGSPVKASAIALVRKGAGLKNFIWVDSQDTAGVDKTILRGCTVWIIGVQRESNEIKRNLANIPATVKRPKAAEVAMLGKGQFYACFHDRTIKVYVQPTWLDDERAIAVAKGKKSAPAAPPAKEVAVAYDEEKARLISENKVLREQLEQLRDELKDLKGRNEALRENAVHAMKSAPASAPAKSERTFSAAESFDNEQMYQAFKTRLLSELPSDPQLLKVFAVRPELEVLVERKTVEVNGDTLRGRIAQLIAAGFFDSARAGTTVESELRSQAFACSRPNVYRETDKLAADGFLRKEEGGYVAVPGMKVNIVEL